MNKKTITILIVILVTAISAVGFWYVNNSQKLGMDTDTEKQEGQVVGQNKNQEQEDIEKEKGQTQNKEKQTNQKQSDTNSDIKYNPDGTIDTSDWKTYRNEEFGFGFKYSQKLEMIFQNDFDAHGSANVLFYEGIYGDVSESSNPLISIINKNIDYLSLDIIGYDYVKDSNFNLKKYIASDLFYYDKGIDISQKIIDWNSIKLKNSEVVINFYVIETIDGQIRTKGAVWISNEKLFNIKTVDKGDKYFEKAYRDISLTFWQD